MQRLSQQKEGRNPQFSRTQRHTSPHARQAFNTPIGDRDLSAWQIETGVTWVQSRSPIFARKLSQRTDARLVMRGVAGGFLRTFEFRHSLAWAQELITRYTRNEQATGTGDFSPGRPINDFEAARGVNTAEGAVARRRKAKR
jgi:hypothetical protein